MPILSEDYKYPLINKFRDVFQAEFSYAKAEGLTLNETVKRRNEGEMIVEFTVSNWTKTTPNTWCGVAFNEKMIDTIRGSRNTYECVFRHNDGGKVHTYTVECRDIPDTTPPVVPLPIPGDVNMDGRVNYKDYVSRYDKDGDGAITETEGDFDGDGYIDVPKENPNLEGLEDYNGDNIVDYNDYVAKWDKNADGKINEHDGDFDGDGFVDNPETMTPNPKPSKKP